MGTGIWSMHFIGMLSFELPIPMAYDVRVTLLSLVLAVIASGFALQTVSAGALRPDRLVIAGICMGASIMAMHYTSTAAMEMLPAFATIGRGDARLDDSDARALAT
jgi:NO-binding membrane sensor protein with MHYT domain